MLYKSRSNIGGRNSDNTEMKGRGCTKLEAAEGEDRRRYRKERQRLYKSIRNRGEDRRQHREEKRRLYKSIRNKRGKFCDNTGRKGRCYTNQEVTEGRGSSTIQRDNGRHTWAQKRSTVVIVNGRS